MAGESSSRFNNNQYNQYQYHPYQNQNNMLYKSTATFNNGAGVSDMIPMRNYYNPGVGGTMSFGGNDRPMVFTGASNLKSPVAGLKHDTGLAAEWTIDEQYKLEEGLAKYGNEPNIMRYIKIAGALRDKTVRDVALRCRWMTRKRRKHEDHISGKKLKDRKDKQVDSYLKNNVSPASSVNVTPYSLTKDLHAQSGSTFSGVLGGTARHLLEENNQAFGQISANLSVLKLQQNADLFSRTRNNLMTILNDMNNMPGIMNRMPPLPVLLNEELATSIFPNLSQPMMFGSSSGAQLKQEPRC